MDLSDHVIGLAIIRGAYERSKIEFIRRTVRSGQTVLDIGAHIGLFAITMAALVGPSGKVYAFEPHDQNADLLQRSIAENEFEDRVTLERAAVGESSGFANLMVPTFTLNSGGAHLIKKGMEASDAHEIRTVKMISLDEYELRRPIEFIKIDIEGAEPLAFRSAKEILREDRPIILSELHPPQLHTVSGCTPGEFVSEMDAHGYDCYILEGGKPIGRMTGFQESHIRSVVFFPKTGIAT